MQDHCTTHEPAQSCTACGATKPLTDFPSNSRTLNGVRSRCKACLRIRHKRHNPVPLLGPNDTKKCSGCGEAKPVAEFRTQSFGDGYHSRCRECGRKVSSAWKQNHPDELSAYRKQEYKEHKAEMRARLAKWQAQNREYCLTKKRQHYAENKEYYRQKHQRWMEENGDAYRERERERDSTPEMRAYYRNKQRERNRAVAAGDVTPKQLEHLYASQLHCAYCQREFTETLPPTIDHIVPISKGGCHTISNLTLACKQCNTAKLNRLISPDYDVRNFHCPESP